MSNVSMNPYPLIQSSQVTVTYLAPHVAKSSLACHLKSSTSTVCAAKASFPKLIWAVYNMKEPL
eukprot:scaffold395467_cov24-Attheya_sp.AAC.1